MSIWLEMQKSGLILHGCLLKQGKVAQSSFPEEYRNHVSVVKQAIVFIFKNLEKNTEGYDEAHLEVGDKHFSGYLLGPELILICFCESDSQQQNLRRFIDDNKQAFSS